MKEIIDKITTYNLFNYLLPGIIFVIFMNKFIGYDFVQDNNFIGGFLYYFIGMIISRIGSLIVEPVLEYLKFLKKSDYQEFVSASKKDSKIELLSETNNSYRTIVATSILLIVVKCYKLIADTYTISGVLVSFVIFILLGTLFLFAYKKQAKYVVKRVNANKEEQGI